MRYNNKFIVAAASLGTFSYLGVNLLAFRRTKNEMLSQISGSNCQYSLDYTKGNALSEFVMSRSALREMIASYKPSWFYFSSVVGNIYSVWLPLKKLPEQVECLRVKSQSGQGGMICYDVVRSSIEPDSKRVVFIVPGVNSNLKDHHINATVK